MTLEWMGKYRLLVEEYIRGANLYSRNYKRPIIHVEDVSLSAAQIQVLEYILENEDVGRSMSSMAERLGITRGAFTKTAAQLEGLSLLEKHHPDGNAKVYHLRLTEKGKRVYAAYSRAIHEKLFAGIFSVAESFTPEQLQLVIDALRAIRGKNV